MFDTISVRLMALLVISIVIAGVMVVRCFLEIETEKLKKRKRGYK